MVIHADDNIVEYLLAGLDMNGSSHVTITGFKSAQALAVDVSGASHLRGDIEAGFVNHQS